MAVIITNMDMPKRCFECKLKLHGTCAYLIKHTGGVNSKERLAECPLREVEVTIGKWVKEETIYGWDGRSYQCSECGRSVHLDPVMEDIDIDYPYCHCGAKMEKGCEDDNQI